MTVANTSRESLYVGNGVTASFPSVFAFFEIAVYVDGVLKTAGLDYSITQTVPGTTGDIIFVTPPANGTAVKIVGDTSLVQETDYVNNDGFDSEEHERALDRLTMIAQEAKRDLQYTLRLPITDDPPNVLPARGPNRFLFSDALNELQWVEAGDATGILPVGVAGTFRMYATRSEFLLAVLSLPSDVDAVIVNRIAATSAFAPLTYKKANSSTGIYGEVTGAGGKYWVPQYSMSPLNLAQWGAIGDNGTTDNKPILQAAIDYLAVSNGIPVDGALKHSNDFPASIYVPPASGRYVVSGTVYIPPKIELYGNRVGSVIELDPLATDNDLFLMECGASHVSYVWGVNIHDLTLQSTKAGSRIIGERRGTRQCDVVINCAFRQLNIIAPYFFVFPEAYLQFVIVDDINVNGEITQIVRGQFSFSEFRNIDKEAHTSIDTSHPYFAIVAPDSAPSSGGGGGIKFSNILVEQNCAATKEVFYIKDVDQVVWDHIHVEITQSLTHFSLDGVQSATIKQLATASTNVPRIKLINGSFLQIDDGEWSGGTGVTDIFDCDSQSHVHIDRLYLPANTGAPPVVKWLTVGAYMAQDVTGSKGAGPDYKGSRTNTNGSIQGGNLFINGSFEGTNYGWQLINSGTPSIDYPTSDLCAGKAMRQIWASDTSGTMYQRQGFTVPSGMIGKSITFSVKAKIVGAAANSYIQGYVEGPAGSGVGATGTRILPGKGWCETHVTFVPTQSGDHYFGFVILNPKATVEYWADECCLSFGTNADNASMLTGGHRFTYLDGSARITPGPLDLAGSGTPEGAVTAPIGSTYRRINGGAGTSFYVKESGTGNTGWVGK